MMMVMLEIYYHEISTVKDDNNTSSNNTNSNDMSISTRKVICVFGIDDYIVNQKIISLL